MMTEVTNDYSENLDLIESCNNEINLLDIRGDRDIYEFDDDNNDLLAVGRLAKPIKNDKELDISFILRIDV